MAAASARSPAPPPSLATSKARCSGQQLEQQRPPPPPPPRAIAPRPGAALLSGAPRWGRQVSSVRRLPAVPVPASIALCLGSPCRRRGPRCARRRRPEGEPIRHGLAPGAKGVLTSRLPAGRWGESHANGGLCGADGCGTRRAPPGDPRAGLLQVGGRRDRGPRPRSSFRRECQDNQLTEPPAFSHPLSHKSADGWSGRKSCARSAGRYHDG